MASTGADSVAGLALLVCLLVLGVVASLFVQVVSQRKEADLIRREFVDVRDSVRHLLDDAYALRREVDSRADRDYARIRELLVQMRSDATVAAPPPPAPRGITFREEA